MAVTIYMNVKAEFERARVYETEAEKLENVVYKKANNLFRKHKEKL